MSNTDAIRGALGAPAAPPTRIGPQPDDDPEIRRFAMLAALCVGEGSAAVLLPEGRSTRLAAASSLDGGVTGPLRTDLAIDALRTGRLLALSPAESALTRPEQPVGFVGVPVTTPEGGRLAVLFAQTTGDVPAANVRALGELAVLLGAYLSSRTSLQRAVEAETELRELTRLNRILLAFSEALARTTTLEETMTTVRELAAAQLEATFCGVVLETSGRFDALDERGLPTDRPLEYTELTPDADHPGPRAVASGLAIFVESRSVLAVEHPTLAARASAEVDGEAYLPIRVGARTGWLWLGWDAPHRTDVRSRRMKLALARYVGQALERVELVAARDAVARTLQEAMLTSLPDVPGLALAARYVPAVEGEQVGGDWYDAIHVDGVTTAVIGDVVGHNIAAAARMGHMRSVLRGFVADRVQTPAQLLERLDNANLRLGTGTMGTAVVAQVRESTGPEGAARVTWSSAGHLAPVVVSTDGTARVLDGASDLMLGVVATERRDHSAWLERGETLLLFTDGLVERRTSLITDALERLCGVLGGVAEAPIDDVVDVALAEMAVDQAHDDVAVLAVRLR